MFATWKNEGLKEPEIREQFGPDKPNRTIVIGQLIKEGILSDIRSIHRETIDRASNRY